MTNKRKIFEELTADNRSEQTSVVSSLINQGRNKSRRAIQLWLSCLFFLVLSMILVGGLTRLNDAGLSITEWAPVVGAIPPLDIDSWQREFERYQQIDEWRIQNQWMSLTDFKVIYWWEWGHRQLGRVIGVVWLVGLIWFWAKKQIPTGWTPRLLLLGALGGLQGLIGWWMVASGLTQGHGILDVASYRLAIHLGLAFLILGYLWWCILRLNRLESELLKAHQYKEPRSLLGANILMGVAFLQVLIGALVAGIDAGQSYTDWPLIGGQIFPPNAFFLDPIIRNFFESPGLVQFMHRIGGYVLVIVCCIVWLMSRSSAHSQTRRLFGITLFIGTLQAGIGVLTVIHGAALPLAILHQFIAIVVWISILQARFMTTYPKPTSVRQS
ncbi:MAG: COX15/CtaA family protein [Aestuariivita sp.]|nr:COX15/CtaA family protein [Aestuariivita sp.]MCY4203472.1 COX15/CtaA family protein [Aestuariivita sp.]